MHWTASPEGTMGIGNRTNLDMSFFFFIADISLADNFLFFLSVLVLFFACLPHWALRWVNPRLFPRLCSLMLNFSLASLVSSPHLALLQVPLSKSTMQHEIKSMYKSEITQHIIQYDLFLFLQIARVRTYPSFSSSEMGGIVLNPRGLLDSSCARLALLQ